MVKQKVIGALGLALIFSLWQLMGKTDSNGGAGLRREIREMGAEQMNTLQALGKSQQEHLSLVAENIEKLKEGNEKKLDQMRETVDEKLQTTLEKRIGESFKLVGEHLEAVQRGLGEMQALATDTADLKKVLTNVSSRGVMGEIQAEQILQNILAPNQYEKNVRTHPDCKGQVEFAIKLPGLEGNMEDPVWLPIDCK